MDITIYDILPKHIDTILSTPTAQNHVMVVRKPAPFNDTVDIRLTVSDFCITEKSFVVGFPGGDIQYFSIPLTDYLKIEVM